jgi:hypothetical protein
VNARDAPGPLRPGAEAAQCPTAPYATSPVLAEAGSRIRLQRVPQPSAISRPTCDCGSMVAQCGDMTIRRSVRWLWPGPWLAAALAADRRRRTNCSRLKIARSTWSAVAIPSIRRARMTLADQVSMRRVIQGIAAIVREMDGFRPGRKPSAVGRVDMVPSDTRDTKPYRRLAGLANAEHAQGDRACDVGACWFHCRLGLPSRGAGRAKPIHP